MKAAISGAKYAKLHGRLVEVTEGSPNCPHIAEEVNNRKLPKFAEVKAPKVKLDQKCVAAPEVLVLQESDRKKHFREQKEKQGGISHDTLATRLMRMPDNEYGKWARSKIAKSLKKLENPACSDLCVIHFEEPWEAGLWEPHWRKKTGIYGLSLWTGIQGR